MSLAGGCGLSSWRMRSRIRGELFARRLMTRTLVGGRRLLTAPRMNQTMGSLQKMPESEYSTFIRVLFGLDTPSPVPADLSSDEDLSKIEWFDPTLNDSQKDAIRFALASREVALIHGPPGVCPLTPEAPKPSVHPSTYTTADRQNSYPHRAHPSAHSPQPPRPRLRPLQHLRRQHRRAPRPSQAPSPPPRPPSPPPSLRPRPLPRRPDPDLLRRRHCP